MTQKLLFVDDSLTMHRVVAITFGQEDVTLVSAHSAAEALERMASTGIDVALIDSHLGDMDGYSLCAKLQQAHRGAHALPVLLLVSDQHPVDEDKRQACGALGSVKKPFDTQTLVARVKEAAAHQGLTKPALPESLAPSAAHGGANGREGQGGQPPRSSPQPSHDEAPRPAFFQAPPPVPLPAEKTNPWTLSVGGPPATEDNLPQEAAHLPRMADLPQMPTWSLEAAGDAPAEGGPVAPKVSDLVPRDIPPHEPLWTEKESTTAEDLRRPEIDVGVVQLARADKERAAEGDIAPAQPPHGAQPMARPAQAAHMPSPQQNSSAQTLTAQALTAAFAELPPQVLAALGPQAAQTLAPVLVQAIERAVWDVLPAIAQSETRAYLTRQPKG